MSTAWSVESSLKLTFRDPVTIEDDTLWGYIRRFVLYSSSICHVHGEDVLLEQQSA